ncbi:hypothetical protein ScPMuIL_002163, partial [Solemya velum]
FLDILHVSDGSHQVTSVWVCVFTRVSSFLNMWSHRYQLRCIESTQHTACRCLGDGQTFGNENTVVDWECMPQRHANISNIDEWWFFGGIESEDVGVCMLPTTPTSDMNLLSLSYPLVLETSEHLRLNSSFSSVEIVL